MTFGTADRRKADVAEGVAVAIGHLATQRGNRLGIVTFGGSRDRRVPPAAGRLGLLGLLTAARVETVEEGVGATSPADALRIANAAAPRGGLVVLVSDFVGRATGWGRWQPLAARHHVIAVEIDDPRESELTDVGELTLIDAETGREVRVDTSSRRLRERFAAGAAAERASLAAELRRLGVDHFVLSTAGSWLRTLAGALRLRGIRLMTFADRSSSSACSSCRPPSSSIGSSSADAAGMRSGSRTWTCSATSCRGRPPGGGTCRPPSTWSRWAPLVLALAGPSMTGRSPPRRGHDHPDARRLRFDGGHGRRAVPSRGRPEGCVRLRRPAAGRHSRSGSSPSSTAPRILVSPTTDRAQLHAAINDLQAHGGTALGDAIATSLEAAGLDPASASTGPSASPAPAGSAAPSGRPSGTPNPSGSAGPIATAAPIVATVLLSDGANSTGELEPIPAAEQAVCSRRPGLHTIALGTADGVVTVPDDQGPAPHAQRATGHRDPRGDRRDDGRALLRGAHGPRPSPRSTRASARRSATRPRSARSPSGSPRRGCSSSSRAPASRPTGSNRFP